nr:inositol transporter 4 [Ipomoea batatas]
MERGPEKAGADKTKFTECWETSRKTPYIMRLAMSAGIGGLLFGYDTGVISGALLYIKEDFKAVQDKTWLQETIVSMGVGGAIVGAALGGWMSDKYGRKRSILIADVVFFFGAIVMATAQLPWMIILGRIFVGLGIGTVSNTSPLYISEASPARIRGALVSINGLFITVGQLLSSLINLAFTRTPGTWRWMLGTVGVPALVQFVLMLSLPESPRWLYRQNKVEEARAILEKIYPTKNEVEEEMSGLKSSLEEEKCEESAIGDGLISKVKNAWSNRVVRRGLYAGITVQVAQNLVGIRMYYIPSILQLVGFASNTTAMALSLITSGLNAVGTIISMLLVDRYGRRRLMIISMFGIISCLTLLSGLLYLASQHSPPVSLSQSQQFGLNSTCSNFLFTPGSNNQPSSWSCYSCVHQHATSQHCAFCSNKAGKYNPGACLSVTDEVKHSCQSEGRSWYIEGCPSKYGIFAVLLLGLFIISYAPGMGTLPWVVNSEIYPLRYRGVGGGIAAVANWVSNLVVSLTFLTLIEAIGSSGTFLLFAGCSLIGLVAIFFLVPETKGLQFEEVEKMLEKGYKPSLFCYNRNTKQQSAVQAHLVLSFSSSILRQGNKRRNSTFSHEHSPVPNTINTQLQKSEHRKFLPLIGTILNSLHQGCDSSFLHDGVSANFDPSQAVQHHHSLLGKPSSIHSHASQPSPCLTSLNRAYKGWLNKAQAAFCLDVSVPVVLAIILK